MIETLFDNKQSIFTYEHNKLVKENQKKWKEDKIKNQAKNDYKEKIIGKSNEKDGFER